jgi:membrane protein YqaA with SNARE-associated domain
MMTAYIFGCFCGYVLGNFISDSVHALRDKEEEEKEEWIEEVPDRHYKKRRRYS